MIENPREKSGPLWLFERAQTSPDQVWLQEVGGRSMTFGAAYDSMLRWGHGLPQHGRGRER